MQVRRGLFKMTHLTEVTNGQTQEKEKMLNIARNIRLIRNVTLTPVLGRRKESKGYYDSRGQFVKYKKEDTWRASHKKRATKQPEPVAATTKSGTDDLTLSQILFDSDMGLDEKLTLTDELIANVRLFIGMESEEEYSDTMSLIKDEGLEVVHEVRIHRPDYFHVLVRLRPTDDNSKRVLNLLPLAAGEEAVVDDVTKVVDINAELIGETLDNVCGMSWDNQIDYFCAKQLGSTDDRLLVTYFVKHVVQDALTNNLSMGRFRIAPYGSSISGFANKYSDLDMCLIDQEAKEYNNLNKWRKDASVIMSQLFQALNPNHQFNPNFRVQEARSIIPGIEKHRLILAKHPIIQSVYNHMGMEFDLSYSDPSVVEMSRLHNYYASQHINYRRMISLLRIWAKLNGATEHGLTKKMSPYILTQLACNYLQRDNLVPMLRTMINESENTYRFCNFTLGFKEKLTQSNAGVASLGDSTSKTSLLHEDASELHKVDCAHVRDKRHILSLLYGFFDYVERMSPLEQFSHSQHGLVMRKTNSMNRSKVYINHPFDETVNVAEQVSIQFFMIFQELCTQSKQQVLQIVNEHNTFPSHTSGVDRIGLLRELMFRSTIARLT